MDERIKEAIKLLNEHDYIVVPVDKSQMAFCETCKSDPKWCTYNSVGYACSSLVCVNEYIKEQIDYKPKIAPIMGGGE